MRFQTALFAVLMAVVTACWFALPAQQQTPASATAVPLDPVDVSAAAKAISQRSMHLKPMLDEVHASDWVAEGAPEAYVSQWNSLKEQNQAIAAVHRFDGDLGDLLKAVRRYQNPALADLLESVAEGGQRGVETLQRYAMQLAGDKDRQLDVVDKEAQRCRAQLAAQPVNRPAAQRKATAPPNPTTTGTSK